MKRFLLALCCALTVASCACASGETQALNVREVYAQARQGWHASYESARGETVTVDIGIDVPDVEAFPCYAARDMRASASAPVSDNQGRLIESGEAATDNRDGFFRYDWPNVSTQRRWAADARKSGALPESFGEPRALMLRFGQFDMETAYAVNNPTTMADAATIIEECARTAFPDASLAFVPHGLHAHVDPGKYKQDKNTGDYVKVQDDPDFQGCLFASFDQTIDGIPVLGYGHQGYADHKSASRKEELRGNLGAICVTQGLKDAGSDEVYRSVQLSLIEPTELLARDVPLCGIDAVIETARGLIEAGKLRTVDSMRLGYAAWLNRAGGYALMPTWVIEGELFETADAAYRTPVTILTDQPGEYATVYIDAQTGELIDPWNTAAGRAYAAPKLRLWDGAAR